MSIATVSGEPLTVLMKQAKPYTLRFDTGNGATILVGTGGAFLNQQDYNHVWTGANANSSALAYYGLFMGTNTNWGRYDFTKRILGMIPMNISSGWDANMIARVQLKCRAVAPILGDLGELGIGVICKGAAGEFYFENHNGTARTQTDLLYAPAGGDQTTFVVFDIEPSIPRIRARCTGGGAADGPWVTITNNVPITASVVLSWICFSIENGNTAINRELQSLNPFFWFYY